jgi:hypothetical protein|tara:strand:+ start:809 stop:1477 length:669 start_codon:yes stop_codon:yes gene_type:complete
MNYKIENFLSTSEVNTVCGFYDRLPYSDEYSSELNRRKLMHYDNPSMPFLKKIFEPKLMSLHKGTVSACTFTDWHNPVEIHTDGWQPQEDQTRSMGVAVLVPLRLNPDTAKSSTIIFNQRSAGPTVTLKEQREHASWNVAEHISPDDNRIENKSEQGVSAEFYAEHLQHIDDPDMLRNFSVSGVHDWSPGCAIVWDRSYFHTSSSFDATLKSKLHAIFFITL